MPNWCDNYLTIKASHETLNAISSYAKREDNVFDFEKIVPMPEYIYRGTIGPEERELYGENNWYDWSCKNWGTKWNNVGACVNQSDISLDFVFETAWSPCEPVIKDLAAMFPDAKIFYRYSECNEGFCGEQEFENGQMTYSMEGDYGEYWFDDLDENDEDENEILKEKDFPGIFYSVESKETMGPVTKCKFSYRDTDEERSVHINGSLWDARNEKSDFLW